MKDTDILKGEITQADETGYIYFESSQDLFDFSKKFYNALLEIPEGKLREMDKKAIEWLELGLVQAEKQIQNKGGLQVMMSNKLVYTIKAVSGVFLEYETFNGKQILDELDKHIKII
jgi:hypothetical protein